jgi:hypothetical protein
VDNQATYGSWWLVLINVAFFIIFAFSFTRPRTRRDWRSLGSFSGFVVALFAEMYGFPLTIYLLSGWLASRYPEVDPFAHDTGHLWHTLLGTTGSAHGVAVLSRREGLSFTGDIASDSAPLHEVVADLIESGVEIHCLRDLTRGGLASALNEIASSAGVTLSVDEQTIPVRSEVQGACEVLGLDPMYVANEGRFVAFVPKEVAEHALTVMRRHVAAKDAVKIGEVEERTFPSVVLKTVVGTHRILDLLSGEQLPRIC